MKRSICLILTAVVFIASSYGAMAAENKTTGSVIALPTPCVSTGKAHKYNVQEQDVEKGDCKKVTKIKRVCECGAISEVEIPAQHDWVLGENKKLVCNICKKKPSISATLVYEDKTLFDGSSCDVLYKKDEEGTRVNVVSNCPGYELKCRYNEKYLKVEQNENGEYVINYVKYYPFKTDFMDYFVEFYFIAEDEKVEDNKYSFTLYPTCTKYVGWNKPDISLKKGKKTTIKANVFGAKKATFTASNKKVVKIVKKKAKKVVIKGVSKGTADITAKAAGKSAKCKVVVK